MEKHRRDIHGILTITVLHRESLVDGIPDRLYSEAMPATPLGWVVASDAQTMMQTSNYRKILEFKFEIHSPLHAGKSCSECTSPITWREIQLSERKNRFHTKQQQLVRNVQGQRDAQSKFMRPRVVYTPTHTIYFGKGRRIILALTRMNQ